MNLPKILIVDDNESIGALLLATFKNDYSVMVAQTGEAALNLMKTFLPQLVILDVMLPDMSGFEICSQIKASPETASVDVIMLSAKTGSVSRSTGYNLGAINYIEKPFELNEVKLIVQSIMSSKSNVHKKVLKIGNLEIDHERMMVIVAGAEVKLTMGEFKVLQYLVKNINAVLSRQQILAVVDPGNLESTDRAIDQYIVSIRKKISGSNLTIKTIYGEGYKLVDNK